MYSSTMRNYFLLLSAFAVSISVTAPSVNIALVQFYLWGDQTPTSLSFAAPVIAKGEEDLAPYKEVMNIASVLIYDRNVTTCDEMDQKITIWANHYFYLERVGNPNLGIFEPGCPTAGASLASLAKGKLHLAAGKRRSYRSPV
ncbi:uncharacterized protein LOC129602519 [Paramacrobiotus metropolitanus]|uniref:uncharacterized protein LOC129602519 n=1 Tax=Paramacrobiotus metropolitanus TaxID=2943436 RepID=UPI002445CC64|nr:uncharacterized protein LOC129602519 [Paramacrobiotus metropolitanus]